jgi:hypothetical protein
MRTFYLDRTEDSTGVSGRGLVAQGVKFNDGLVVVRWLGATPTTTIHQSIESVELIHCHDGLTVIRWTDSASFARGGTDAYQDRCENAPFWLAVVGSQ